MRRIVQSLTPPDKKSGTAGVCEARAQNQGGGVRVREGRRREGCRLRERRRPSLSVWAKSVSFRAKQEKLVLSERPAISRAVTLSEMSYLFKAARVPFSVTFQKEATRVRRGGAFLCCILPTSSSADRRGSRATWRGASWSAGCYVTARSPRRSPRRRASRGEGRGLASLLPRPPHAEWGSGSRGRTRSQVRASVWFLRAGRARSRRSLSLAFSSLD